MFKLSETNMSHFRDFQQNGFVLSFLNEWNRETVLDSVDREAVMKR